MNITTQQAANKKNGIEAEFFFASKLNQKGIPHTFIDDWYDYDVNGYKVEVKSCQLSHYGSSKNRRCTRVGRFDFTKVESREKQFNDDIWVCFILRHRYEYMLLGLCKATKLKKKRYVCLHQLRNLRLISFEDWCKKVLIKKVSSSTEVKGGKEDDKDEDTKGIV